MSHPLTQDELKTLVGQAAIAYVPAGEVVGVGTGSTVNKFIDALAMIKDRIRGAVSSSEASTQRLRAAGIAVFEAEQVEFHPPEQLEVLVVHSLDPWSLLFASGCDKGHPLRDLL